MNAKRNTNTTNDIAPRWRYLMVLVGFVCLVVVMLLQAFKLQVIDRGFLVKQGDRRHNRVVPVYADRGNIVDRRGVVLAASAPIVNVWCDVKVLLAQLHDNQQKKRQLQADLDAGVMVSAKNKKKIEALVSSIAPLANALDMPVDELSEHLYKRRNKRFAYVKKRMPPPVEHKIKRLGFPSVYIEKKYRRYYPVSEVASPLLGFTGANNQGQEGIEKAFDASLRAIEGKQRVVRDLKGRVIEDMGITQAAISGHDLTLSIDLRVQHMTHRALLKAMQLHNADKAMATVLDVRTGEVLAMVSLPSFNPNELKKGRASLRRNRVIIDVFEPGSTMKPLVMAVALENKTLGLNEKINTSPGYFVVGGKTIQDSHDYGKISPKMIIAKSSNVGMAKVIHNVKDADLFDGLSRFGIGMNLNTGFPGERSGRLPNTPYGAVQKATMSYGYGLSATTLQMAHAYSVIASGGMSRPVSLIKTTVPMKAVLEERVLSKQTADDVLAMLKSVVSEGTGKKAKIAGYSVAGKTGTAYKLVNGQYDSDKYIASFIGIVPADNPRYVMAVVVDNPKNGVYYGGSVAAPVFAEVMSSTLPLLGIAPNKSYGRVVGKMAPFSPKEHNDTKSPAVVKKTIAHKSREVS